MSIINNISTIKKISLSIILLLTLGNFSQSGIETDAKTKPAFNYSAFGNVANYFENEKDLLDFFNFQKGEVIAEIGAGDGQNIGGFSILTDDITFYAQDIDSKVLNEKKFKRVIRKCTKFKSPLTNHFQLTIGTEKTTNLPDNSFDKIIVISAFHEFTFIDEMLEDIRKKLKPQGQVYILEAQCLAKTHKNISSDETTTIMKKHNFNLIKVDGKDKNGSNGLYRAVFVKTN